MKVTATVLIMLAATLSSAYARPHSNPDLGLSLPWFGTDYPIQQRERTVRHHRAHKGNRYQTDLRPQAKHKARPHVASHRPRGASMKAMSMRRPRSRRNLVLAGASLRQNHSGLRHSRAPVRQTERQAMPASSKRKATQRRSYGLGAMAGHDPRPRAWCGWFMRHLLGVTDRSLNLARNWSHWGHASGGPQVGAVVVWPHHVGRIVGTRDSRGRWLVQSGNDGHAVKIRYRSVAGAIAFRRG
jgi:hypothetical protein